MPHGLEPWSLAASFMQKNRQQATASRPWEGSQRLLSELFASHAQIACAVWAPEKTSRAGKSQREPRIHKPVVQYGVCPICMRASGSLFV